MKRDRGYRVLRVQIKIENMKEKRDWEDTDFTEKIRISREDLEYVKKIKGKKSLARTLQEIIKKYKYGNK